MCLVYGELTSLLVNSFLLLCVVCVTYPGKIFYLFQYTQTTEVKENILSSNKQIFSGDGFHWRFGNCQCISEWIWCMRSLNSLLYLWIRIQPCACCNLSKNIKLIGYRICWVYEEILVGFLALLVRSLIANCAKIMHQLCVIIYTAYLGIF